MIAGIGLNKRKEIQLPPQLSKTSIKLIGSQIPDDIEGFESEIRDAVSRAKETMTRFRQIVESMRDVQEKNEADDSQTDIGKKINTVRFAEKKQDEMIDLASSDSAGNPSALAEKIESKIENSLDSSKAKGPEGREIRDHVKSLPKKEKLGFVSKAISRKDNETVKAILGSKPFLSGLSDAQYDTLKTQYRRINFSSEMKAANELRHIDNRMFKGTERVYKMVNELKTKEVTKAMAKQEEAREAMEV